MRGFRGWRNELLEDGRGVGVIRRDALQWNNARYCTEKTSIAERGECALKTRPTYVPSISRYLLPRHFCF